MILFQEIMGICAAKLSAHVVAKCHALLSAITAKLGSAEQSPQNTQGQNSPKYIYKVFPKP
jgi:hypothetical protein